MGVKLALILRRERRLGRSDITMVRENADLGVSKMERQKNYMTKNFIIHTLEDV
jgi:hypothetical protein